jgi:hypothetical protein
VAHTSSAPASAFGLAIARIGLSLGLTSLFDTPDFLQIGSFYTDGGEQNSMAIERIAHSAV